KKNASQKELDAVEEKITNTKVMLGERLGFLEELKKEKEAAEKYSTINEMLKRTNYTILFKRGEAIGKELQEIIRKLSEYDAAAKQLGSKILELDSISESLSSKRNEAARALNERSSELNESNRKLEELKRNIAVSESEVESLKHYATEIEAEIKSLSEENKNGKAKLEENIRSIPRLESEILSLKAEIEHLKPGALSEEGKADMEAYENGMKNFEKISSELESAKKTAMAARLSILELESSKKALGTELERISKALSEYRKSEQEIISTSNKANRDQSSAREELESIKSRKRSAEAELQKLSERKISLREAIATHGGDSNRAGKVLSEKLASGFYGRAMELLKYDDRYSEAINAAAGGRLSYFVVESIEVADRAVKILKENKLGRASFIPLNAISYAETQKIAEGDPLIDYVEFDSKFGKAFKFIFSNTYLVGDIRGLEKGNRHRFVTIDGEILEQSGVVSGGFSKNFSYAKAVSELKSIEENEKGIRNDIENMQSLEEDARQRFGKAETIVMSSSMELEAIRANIKSIEEEKRSAEAKLASLEKELNAKSESATNIETIIEKLAKELERIKSENSSNYGRISDRFLASKDGQRAKEIDDKIKACTSKLEKAMTEKAALGKECDILNSRIAELEKGIESKNASLEQNNRKRSELEKKIKELKVEAGTIEESIKAHDKKSAGLYGEIKKMEEELSKNGFEKGKLASEKERIEREAIGMQATKGQLQTRLSDIKAELASYDRMEVVDGEIEHLEKESYRLRAELEGMGSVNMRAPEMYMEKSKDVEGVQEKIMTLETERNSILSMISQLEARKLEVFNDTFDKVNKKFMELYKSVFKDGEGNIVLDEPKDPFNSGLSFNMFEGKSRRRAERLSGGEKSMLMLIMLFSIQMCRPLSFYIFDEIDTALDKQNSKTLSALIKKLSSISQFVVVSHNDTLISYADTAIGVAKKEGESNVFGVEIVSAKEQSK
ncbi:chromosome segregation protein SMC, partial [Candidatus Marsarchaeota archaeon]|nr:chromosome segregation protein SMC [Candidatus Marsarchaeota archaeon]